MGLDMYGYARERVESEEKVELAYWRKHNALHSWMENLYRRQGGSEEFNCVEVELSESDLNQLEEAVRDRTLQPTSGFFFGSSEYSEEDWSETSKQDLDFIAKAREQLAMGHRVFYNSWW